MERFLNFFRTFGAGRLMVLLGVAMGVAATLAFTVFHVGSTPMAALFYDVPAKEMGQIVAQLDQQGIKYRLQGESTILVEADKVSRTRMDLESKGLPSSASVGFEIFDNASPLGQTDFMNNVQMRRALQGTLERDIKSLHGVTEAHVILNKPEEKIFSDEAVETTASVTVGFTRTPDPSEVAAIQNLVAAASGMKANRVTVIDQAGKVLAGGEDESNAQLAALEVESGLERAVREVVQPVVGIGNLRVSVRADLDKTHTTSRDVRYDPDGQVLLSSGTSTNASRNGAANGGAATTGGNVPGGDGASSDGYGSSNDGESTNNNYQNSVKETTEVIQPGKINKLSASVVINGVLAADGAAPKAGEYSQAQIDQIKSLVATAIGYDPSRDGENAISVMPMKFPAPTPPGGEAEVKAGFMASMQKADLMRIGEIAVLFVVALLTIFFVARPLIKGAATGGGGFMPMPMMAGAGAGGGDSHVLASASGPMGAQLAYDPTSTPAGAAIAAAQAANPSFDIARIEGQVKVSAVKQVSEFVERHPDESVSILRSWLHEA